MHLPEWRVYRGGQFRHYAGPEAVKPAEGGVPSLHEISEGRRVGDGVAEAKKDLIGAGADCPEK
jgi:hypothetical protein